MIAISHGGGNCQKSPTQRTFTPPKYLTLLPNHFHVEPSGMARATLASSWARILAPPFSHSSITRKRTPGCVLGICIHILCGKRERESAIDIVISPCFSFLGIAHNNKRIYLTHCHGHCKSNNYLSHNRFSLLALTRNRRSYLSQVWDRRHPNVICPPNK